jgi:putative SOS response-associated peptidase YedK
MCFTVNVNIVKEELEKRYGGELIDHDNYRPSYYYHAFSFPELPVVVRHPSGDNMLRPARWGLIPSWTGSVGEAEKIRKMTLNARSESILEKPAFADSFSRRRCLLPVHGFYEWKHEGSKKIPYYIYHPSEKIMSIAAIYDRWSMPDKSRDIYTFSVITTSANKMMSEIHNTKMRMPVIIDPGNEEKWLYGGTRPGELADLMRTYPDDILKAHTISPLIGTGRGDRNTADLIKPYNYPDEPRLF